MYEDQILDAIQFISQKHKNQKRKIFDYPYVSHPLMVYHMVTQHSNDVNVHLAALLHDVVEDTDASIEEVKNKFGTTVAEYVSFLSEDQSLEWKECKELYRQQLASAPPEVLLIKASDLIYNFQDYLYILRNYSIDEFHKLCPQLAEWAEIKEDLLNTLHTAWPQNPLLPKVREIFEVVKVEYGEKEA